MKRGEIWLVDLDPADGLQVRSVSYRRLVKKIRALQYLQVAQIVQAI